MNGTNVPKVLKNGILELRLHMKYNLCPVLVFGVSKNPTAVILGFYDEDAKSRNENMVNLSCSMRPQVSK